MRTSTTWAPVGIRRDRNLAMSGRTSTIIILRIRRRKNGWRG
jgi:hypothetical protein